ncbi:MAG: flagellar biosynthesis protein FlgE [Pseudomonadota bacterium]|nr:flagellar biosynthesis protein FlgE [Permianibacter sp.]
MEIRPAFQSGIEGFQRATQRAAEASQQIAQAGTTQPEQDLVKPVVELKQAEQQAAASAKVIETENRVLGSLLDIRA